jgi:hypothetical protein
MKQQRQCGALANAFEKVQSALFALLFWRKKKVRNKTFTFISKKLQCPINPKSARN